MATREELRRMLALANRSASDSPIFWNPYNKVVQDHRDGMVYQDLTDHMRQRLGLPTPWTAEMAEREVHEAPVFAESYAGLTTEPMRFSGPMTRNQVLDAFPKA